jgi:hypothetical protein
MPEYAGRFIPTKGYSGINAKKQKKAGRPALTITTLLLLPLLPY